VGNARFGSARRHHGRQAAAAAQGAGGEQRAERTDRRGAGRRRARRLGLTLDRPLRFSCGRFEFSLDRPLLLGVVNITPDSFSDGGRFLDPQAAIAQGRRLIDEGADILDIGGESSRPGAQAVAEEEELQRILPVLKALKDVPVSVDTRRPSVMRAVLAEGASMINDIEALQAPGALEAVAASDCGVCLMHKKGEPATMQNAPSYRDVALEVRDFLAARISACQIAGIEKDRITIDPGFGFGKTVEHNFKLLKRLTGLTALGVPVVAGWSRKSTLGTVTGRPVGERLPASLAVALLALQVGAKILRVHDVKETRDVIAVWEASRK
jgi:dihydropteroate synthase